MKRNPLSLAINGALAVSAALLVNGNVHAQDEEPIMEEITVTGSRIVRSEGFDAGANVVIMDRAQIDNLSLQSAADVLRSSPLNSLGSFNERSGSSAQSNATIDLRGLGSDRTLVLFNGRRMTGSPNLGASSININMLPMAAVGRTDIMADGGSAVYGSDAVAGVVNMVTRKGFEGVEFTLNYGDRSEDDGGEEGFSIIGGAVGEKGSFFAAAEYSKRDPIFDRDREYTAARAADNNNNGYIDAYSGDTDGYSLYGASIWLYDATTGYDHIMASNNCPEAGGEWLGVVDANSFWGGSTGQDTFCMYGYANASANKASLDRINTFMEGDYQISDNVEFYGSALISQVKSFGRYAPPAAAWDDMPADYGDVPFDIDALIADGTITDDYLLRGYYRWTNIGPRDGEVTDLQVDFVGGLRGDITDNIQYDVYAQKSRYDSKEYGYYYLSYPGLDYVLNNGIDPFSAEGASAMSATTTQDNYTDMIKYYGQIQLNAGDLLGGGDVYFLAGAEYFETEYQNKYDRASEGGFVGGSSGNSSSGDRDVTAFFLEAAVPVTDVIDVSLAARYDDYSDFGSELSPSLSATWAVLDSLSLRTRWSQGFRAPGLDQLYGPDTFSAEDATDYLRCQILGTAPEQCGSAQYDTYYTTNEDLDAETSETFSLGVNWEFVDGWNVDVGYWSVEIENVIAQWDTQDIFYAEAAGIDLSSFDGLSVTRPTAGGRPSEVFSTFVNAGELSAEGIDLKVSGVVESKAGVFNLDLLVAEQLSYEQELYPGGPNQDVTGFYLNPTTRAQLALGYGIGRHSVGFVVDYLGPHAYGNSVDDVSFDLVKTDDEYGSYTTMTLHYGFDAGSLGKVKVGARNLTNEEPVLSAIGTFERDTYDLYDGTGRVFFLEYKLAFD